MRAKMEQYRTFTQWTENDCQDVGKWFTDYMQYAGYLRPTTPKMFKMMIMTAFPPLWDTTQPDLGETCPKFFVQLHIDRIMRNLTNGVLTSEQTSGKTMFLTRRACSIRWICSTLLTAKWTKRTRKLRQPSSISSPPRPDLLGPNHVHGQVLGHLWCAFPVLQRWRSTYVADHLDLDMIHTIAV